MRTSANNATKTSAASGLGFPLLSFPEIFRDYFFVPNYQRSYAWSSSNVDDLSQDLLHLMGVPDADIVHYTGTLVLTEPAAQGSPHFSPQRGKCRICG